MNRLRQALRERITVVAGDLSGQFTATLILPADFELFPDHFPGQPVFPGVCLLQLVLVAAEIHGQRGPLQLRQVNNAKFLAPVLPDQPLIVQGQATPQAQGLLALKATVVAGNQKAAIISLVAAWRDQAATSPE